MPTLFYLIGLPGAGKSTWAKNNSNNNTIVVSSDELRIQLYNDVNDSEHSNEVFSNMYNITRQLLLDNKNVIYDATGISSKRRTSFLKQIKDINCKKIAVYFATHIFDCLDNNSNRDRVVNEDAINRMYKCLSIPMYHEGWDEIRIIGTRSTNYSFNLEDIDDYSSYEYFLDKSLTSECINFPQDNPHHTLSLSRHMYYVYDYLRNNHRDKEVQIAALLHDIGKVECKFFKPDSRYANFYGHENVSAQLAIIYLLKTGMNDKEIINIATYIQLHMRLLNLQDNIKAKEKFSKLVGDKIFNNLIEFRNADSLAK